MASKGSASEKGEQEEVELEIVTTEDIKEDIFDGEDELNEVDFSEAEDVTEKRLIRHIFKVGFFEILSGFSALS